MSSYRTAEDSARSGNPIELFRFTSSNFTKYYTSASYDVEHDGNYIAIPIMRNEVEQTNDISRSDIRITIGVDTELSHIYMTDPPDGITTVTIFRGHVGLGEYITMWKGRVVSVTYSAEEATINCESIFTSLKRYGLLAKFQYLCRHALYGSGCGIGEGSFTIGATVTSINGVELTLGGISSSNYLLGGILHVGGSMRQILGHSGNVISINRVVASLEVNDAVTVSLGCNHTVEHCKGIFNNLVNYGGFPYIPTTNPFAELGNRLA